MTRKIFISALVLLVLIFSFSLFRLKRHPEPLQEILISVLRERFEINLAFEEAKIVLTPFPVIRTDQIHLQSVTRSFPEVRARQAEFSVRWLPLLWGELRPSGVEIQGAEAEWQGVVLEDISLSLDGLSSAQDVRFEWTAKIFGKRGNLRGKGSLRLGSQKGKGFDVESSVLKTDLFLDSLSVAEGPGSEFVSRFLQTPAAGNLSGSFHLEKEKGKNLAQGKAHLEVTGLQYREPPVYSVTAETEIFWDFKTHAMEFREAVFDVPFGKLFGAAIFNLETGEISEARLTGRKVVLEELARHFPKLFSALPLDTGFSGQSDFDISVRGTKDYLSFHGAINLASANVNFGKVFSKPKDFPLGLHFDLMLKKQEILAGDFSVRIRQMTLKGALVDLDLRTGQGEATVISNKFDLSEWSQLLTPLKGCQASGSVKVLVNLKGNLIHLDETDKMFNLNLDNVTLLSPAGEGIEKADLSADFSNLNFKVRNFSFEVGGYPVEFEAEVTTPTEFPLPNLTVVSPRVDLRLLGRNLQPLLDLFPEREWGQKMIPVKTAVKNFVPEGTVLENLNLKVRTAGGKIRMEDSGFELWGGRVRFHGEGTWPSERPLVQFEVSLERVPLARYFELRDPSRKIFEGNLFLKGSFKSEGGSRSELWEHLKGEGTALAANGEWSRLDLAASLRQLHDSNGAPLFKNFIGPDLHSTPFHDLNLSWKFQGGNTDISDFILSSEDFWAEGEGKVLPDGTLNGRLGVYLSAARTDKFLESLGDFGEGGGERLGPVPYLLVGDLSEPKIQPDDSQLAPFLEAIRNRRFRKILKAPFKNSEKAPAAV